MKTCTFEGCEKLGYRRGYCRSHYRRLLAGKGLVPLPLPPKRPPVCAFQSCEKPHYGLGYCKGHYLQQYRNRSLRALDFTPSDVYFEGASWCVTLLGTDENSQRGAIVGAARISEEDCAFVSQFRWNLSHGYARRSDGKLLHVLLLDPPKGMEVDHINGTPTDCRRENLRIVTHKQNMQNLALRRDSTTMCRGIVFDKRSKRYSARVTVNGRLHYGGYYETLAEADAAASALRQELMSHTNEDRKNERKTSPNP